MNVDEALQRFGEMPADSVLAAKPPFTWGADAVFVELTDNHCLPPAVVQAGYQYLIGREDIEHLLRFARKKRLSSRAVAEFILHYAINDSAPAWIEDVPEA